MATAGAIAVAAAATAYVNGRYNLSQDFKLLKTLIGSTRRLNSRTAAKKASLWYDFEEQVSLRADKCAVWYRQGPNEPVVEYTWQELYNNSLRYGQFFLDQGVESGEYIATYLINSPEFIMKTLGCWSIGCAPAEINYHLEGKSLIHCLKVSGSKILVVDEDSECRQRIEASRSQIENELGMRIFVLDKEMRQKIGTYPATRPGDEYREHVDGRSPIFLVYTSGTTGLPKACGFRTERSYVSGIPTITSGALQPGDRWYDCMPLYHGTGGTTAVGCMISGVTLCLGRRFSTTNFWKDVHDSGAHGFVYVGETARYLLAAPPSNLDKAHNLKVMFGNGLRPDVWASFQSRFNVPQVVEFFNSSEGVFSLVNFSRNTFARGSVGNHGAILRFMLRNSYIPVQIDHDDAGKIWRDPKTGFGKRNTYEEGGEILVACENKDVFAGYHNNEEATSKRFERDVFKQGDLYYRTGDALRRDADGRWYFLDRLGDTFRWKSENVSTAEVAEVLGHFPGVLEANVYGVLVPGHEGRAGCAAVFVKPEDRANFNWSGLFAHARQQLPKYAVPVFIRVVKEPTPIHNNKQNKVPLRNEGVDLSKIATGTAGPEDKMLWVRPSGSTYEPFREQDYAELAAGKARL